MRLIGRFVASSLLGTCPTAHATAIMAAAVMVIQISQKGCITDRGLRICTKKTSTSPPSLGDHRHFSLPQSPSSTVPCRALLVADRIEYLEGARHLSLFLIDAPPETSFFGRDGRKKEPPLGGDAPDFVEVGEAGIAVDHAMRR